jgi:hypothetical protein
MVLIFSKFLMGEEAESGSSNRNKPSGQSEILKLLLAGVVGALITGIFNVYVEGQKSERESKLENEKFEENKKIERQKLDADLVKLALQSSGLNGAKTLGFMVQTHLIEDPEIREGINRYLTSNSPVPILQEHGNFQEDFPWNAKNIITIRAPHGGPFASVSTEGVVKLERAIQTPTGTEPGYILDQSGIKSANASFSQNGEALFVYNKQEAAIYFTQPDTIRGEQHFRPAIRISPPNGILYIWLSEDGKTIGVTGTDNKQVIYDLDGNETKEQMPQ